MKLIALLLSISCTLFVHSASLKDSCNEEHYKKYPLEKMIQEPTFLAIENNVSREINLRNNALYTLSLFNKPRCPRWSVNIEKNNYKYRKNESVRLIDIHPDGNQIAYVNVCSNTIKIEHLPHFLEYEKNFCYVYSEHAIHENDSLAGIAFDQKNPHSLLSISRNGMLHTHDLNNNAHVIKTLSFKHLFPVKNMSYLQFNEKFSPVLAVINNKREIHFICIKTYTIIKTIILSQANNNHCLQANDCLIVQNAVGTNNFFTWHTNGVYEFRVDTDSFYNDREIVNKNTFV